jgi:hypothetical protein
MSYGPHNIPPGMRHGEEEYESRPLRYSASARMYWFCPICRAHCSEDLRVAAAKPPRERWPARMGERGGMLCDRCIASGHEEADRKDAAEVAQREAIVRQ